MGQHVMLDGIPLGMIENTVTTTAAIGVFIASVIPFLASVLLGVRFLVKRPVYNAAFPLVLSWNMDDWGNYDCHIGSSNCNGV